MRLGGRDVGRGQSCELNMERTLLEQQQEKLLKKNQKKQIFRKDRRDSVIVRPNVFPP